MESLIKKKKKFGHLVLELGGLEYCSWYPSLYWQLIYASLLKNWPLNTRALWAWVLCGTRVHQARVPFCIGHLFYNNIKTYSLNFLKPSLPTFPQLLSHHSLSQSPSQLSLTFSISLSNSPTRFQSPFQSHSRSHSRSPSRSVARSPFRSVAHVLGLPLTRYVSLSLHLQFKHWVFVGICVCKFCIFMHNLILGFDPEIN